ADRVLTATEALLLLGVVVLRAREPGLPAGLDPVVEDRIFRLRRLRAERTVRAAPLALSALPGLAAAEVRQHVALAPAARAVAGPAVVVARMAARVGHHVDRRAAAEHFAAHRFDAAIVEVGLGFRVIAPVVHAMLVHLAHAERNRDQRVAVAAA